MAAVHVFSTFFFAFLFSAFVFILFFESIFYDVLTIPLKTGMVVFILDRTGFVRLTSLLPPHFQTRTQHNLSPLLFLSLSVTLFLSSFLPSFLSFFHSFSLSLSLSLVLLYLAYFCCSPLCLSLSLSLSVYLSHTNASPPYPQRQELSIIAQGSFWFVRDMIVRSRKE